jgi:hypothetical protein
LKARPAYAVAFLAGVLSLTGCGNTKDDPSAAAGSSNTTGGTNSSTGGSASNNGDAPTWYQDIAPLVSEHCQSCHTDGGIAPFSLQTYAQAKMWSGAFEGVLPTGDMPPFLAAETADCKPRFGFKDDLRLSQAQIDLFMRWNAAGCPEGDPKTATPLPASPELELKDAEVSVTIPAPVTIDGTGDKFICFSLAPDMSPLAATGAAATLLGDRVLINAAQVHAGNAAIVHHVLVYTDEAGQSAALAGDKGYYDCFGGPKLDAPSLILAWAPGATPVTAPEGVAMVVPSKGRLVMQVHYHPTGASQTDSATSLQLRGYGSGIPTYVSTLKLIGNARSQNASGMGLQPGPDDGAQPEFRIPAGAQNHTETMLFQMPASTPEYRLWSLGTHMHYVGTDMHISLTRAAAGTEPADECLLDTPKWDFNWQRGYRYDVPIDQAPTLKAGDVLNLRCTYDNTMQNSFVSEALFQQGLTEPRDVVLGEETLDEMCLGVFGIAQKVSDLLK